MRKVAILLLVFWLACGARGVVAQTGAEPDTGVKSPAINCDYLSSESEKEACRKCILEKKSFWTVFGCLPSDPNGFAAFLLRFALGIGGGVAFLGSLLGSFYLLTSAGNPERINQGKKLLFYSITGLLVIVFAVFILQFLGLNLLGIPEFGK